MRHTCPQRTCRSCSKAADRRNSRDCSRIRRGPAVARRKRTLTHVTDDPLVLWGWNFGEGRQPGSIPHTDFVAAMTTCIDGGCAIPE